MIRRSLMLLALTFTLAAAAPALAQLPPDQELKKLKIADGMEIGLFASEPMITNPSAIDVDSKGRVWVAEIQWYRGAAKTPPADKIKVLEDTDGDGVADKVTTFADGLFCPMSVCVAGDKVYVATSPDLWVFEDKDGDLKADGPPKKLLTGFGGYNSDHGAHSLVLGPDHKWWMSHGDAGFDVTGTDGSRMKYQWGGMLRGELDGSNLETVAVNFRNPYELCVSSFGEAYCSDNDNDGNFSARICWIMEGGNYGWFGGPAGPRGSVPAGTPFGEHWHFRGHIPGNVPATLVTGFGSPAGICFYEGDAFGPKFKDAPLHTDPGPREVRLYRHEAAGAGKKATSEVFLTSAGDDYFRPDDICTGPDGSLFVSDWYDGGVGGNGYNNPNQGRIFRVTPRGKALKPAGKPGPFAGTPEALEGLRSPNLATQFLARERLLAEGPKAVPALKKLLADAEPDVRARAAWVLDRIGGDARAPVVALLKDDEPRFRALAIRILGRHGDAYADALLALADDPSPEVRREVLLSTATVKGPKALDALAKIAATYDGSDRYLLEAINIAAGGRKAELLARLQAGKAFDFRQFPLLQVLDPRAAAEFLVAKLAAGDLGAESGRAALDAAGAIPSPDAGRALLRLVAKGSTPPELRRLALEKIGANLPGPWKEIAGEATFGDTVAGLLADPATRTAALTLVGQQQMRRFGTEVLKLASSEKVDAPTRRQAIGVAALLNVEGTAAALAALLNSPDGALRAAAADAMVDLQDAKAVRKLLAGEGVAPELSARAAERLMGTPGGALVVLRLLDGGTLPPKVQEQALARAASIPDANVRALFEKYLPEALRPKRLGDAVKADEILALDGDARRGEQVFRRGAVQCRTCHVVQGEGGKVGPDLSAIGKKYERKALLETILEPSRAIAPEYVPHLLETTGGLVFAGFLAEKTDKEVVLKDAQGKVMRFRAAEVEALVPQKTSLMPELALKDVSAADAADLLAYLKSLAEDVQAVTRFRVLGPFAADAKAPLDTPNAVEKDLAKPDLNAVFKGANGKATRWEVVAADEVLGFPAFDSVRYDQSRGLSPNDAFHYLLTFAESATDQEITLLLGSDDGCKVWVDGQEVFKVATTRALGFAQDRARAKLLKGRNVIVVKVNNGNGAGGASLAIGSASPVQLKTE